MAAPAASTGDGSLQLSADTETERKNWLSLRRWMIFFITGALVTLMKLKYPVEEIIDLFKSHTMIVKAFIIILFLDFATLYASYKSSTHGYHLALVKIGIMLDVLLTAIGLLAIDPFLGWLIFVIWILWVVSTAYKLYNSSNHSMRSFYNSFSERLSTLYNMMAHHTPREEGSLSMASHTPREEGSPSMTSHTPREEESQLPV